MHLPFAAGDPKWILRRDSFKTIGAVMYTAYLSVWCWKEDSEVYFLEHPEVMIAWCFA